MAFQEKFPALFIEQATVDGNQRRVLQGTLNIEVGGNPLHARSLFSGDDDGSHAAVQLGRILCRRTVQVPETEAAAVCLPFRLLSGKEANPGLIFAQSRLAGGKVNRSVILIHGDRTNPNGILGPVGTAGDAAFLSFGKFIQFPPQQIEELRGIISPLKKHQVFPLVKYGHLGTLAAEQGAEQRIFILQVFPTPAKGDGPVQSLPDALKPGGDENGVEPNISCNDVCGHIAEHRVVLRVFQMTQSGLQFFNGFHREDLHLII